MSMSPPISMRGVARLASSAVSLLALFFSAPASHAQILDLADIVGGGDGTGTGMEQQGIATQFGLVTTSNGGTPGGTPNLFSAVPANPFVDGVFVPDGGPLNDAIIPITSTGLTATGISDGIPFSGLLTIGQLWNGDYCPVHCMPAVLGSRIAAWGNHGITFDLDAIEASHGEEALVLDLFATNSHSSVTGGMQFSEIGSFHVFVDGVQVDSVNLQRGSNIFAFPRIYLEPSDRFVTLVTGSQGSLVADFQYWITPTLRLPEPGLGMGLLPGAGALAMASRTRRRGASAPIGPATAAGSPIRR